MKISKFRFHDPVLLDLKFTVNDDFESFPEDQRMRIGTTIDIEPLDDETSALVTVTVEVGDQKPTAPFFISVQEQAEFQWETDGEKIPEEELDRLLHQNAPALLVSYIRPIIASVTENSPYPAFHLPYLDLREQAKND